MRRISAETRDKSFMHERPRKIKKKGNESSRKNNQNNQNNRLHVRY